MSIETDLYAVLSAALTEPVYPLIASEKAPSERVTFQLIDGVPENTLDGHSGLVRSRIQVDAWNESASANDEPSYTKAKILAGEIKTAVLAATTFKALLISEQDFYESDPKTYRVSVDFSIWHQE